MGDHQNGSAHVRQVSEMFHGTFCCFLIQTRSRFVSDDQSGFFHHCRRDQHSPVHPSGQLKRIKLLCLFFQIVTSENSFQLLLGRRIFFPFPYLRSDLHQGIQGRNALGYHNDFLSSEFFYPFFGKFLSQILDISSHAGVIGQNSHYPMGQETFPGSAGSCHRYHFSSSDFYVQVPDDREFCLMHSSVILGKNNIHMFDFQDCLFFHAFLLLASLLMDTSGIQHFPQALSHDIE